MCNAIRTRQTKKNPRLLRARGFMLGRLVIAVQRLGIFGSDVLHILFRYVNDLVIRCPGHADDFEYTSVFVAAVPNDIEPGLIEQTAKVLRILSVQGTNVCRMTIDLCRRSEERRVGKECRSRWSP